MQQPELVALDNEELLHVALHAMAAGRHGEALCALKQFLQREPGHSHAGYLLAALHAQLGMHQRAVKEYQAIVAAAPAFALARFQLGQLLLLTADPEGAKEVLAPLGEQDGALTAYGRALCALVDGGASEAVRQLRSGLALPKLDQAIAGRMRVLLGQLLSVEPGSSLHPANGEATGAVAAPAVGEPHAPQASLEEEEGGSQHAPDPLAQHLLLHGYSQLGLLDAGDDGSPPGAASLAPRLDPRR